MILNGTEEPAALGSQKSGGVEDNGSNDLMHIARQLTEAWKQLKAVQMEAASYREEYLTERANHYGLRPMM